MSPWLPFTLVIALTSPSTELTYASPPLSAKPTLDQHEVSRFSRGARVFVASDDVVLRAAPAGDAEKVAKLAFGAEVRVLERGQRAALSSRVDHWYRVEVLPTRKERARTGWLFGATVTPFVSRVDLDEDKAPEQVSASWSERHAVVVRVHDEGQQSAAEWRPAAGWRGGHIRKLVTHPASAAGVPLVEIEVRIGAPDDGFRTTWRVFYAYRRPAGASEGPRVLEEVFSTYRDGDVDVRVTFDPATKTAEVRSSRKGGVTSTERHLLAPEVRAPAGPPHEEHECFVHVGELPPLLPKGTRAASEQYVVEEQPLPGGGRVVVRHGGCVHYTQVWSVLTPGKAVPAAVAAQLTAAKEALAPFEGAGPILEALTHTLADKTFDEQGGFPCGDAVCAVERGTLFGAPALVVTYDFPL